MISAGYDQESAPNLQFSADQRNLSALISGFVSTADDITAYQRSPPLINGFVFSADQLADGAKFGADSSSALTAANQR